MLTMKQSRSTCIAIILTVLALGLCCSKSTDPPPQPEANTAPTTPMINEPSGAPTNGSTNQPLDVTLRWTCTDVDGDPITYDVHFGTNTNPTLVSSSQSGNSYTPSVLSNSTTYYWRIVAKDDHAHSASSSTWEFTTGASLNVPVLSTSAVTSITQTTAQCGGSITSDGGTAVTARGVCWSTNTAPTTADNKTTDGSGTGSFTSALTSLIPGTTYYVRAYATNSVGTGYGTAVSLTTAAATQSPTVTTSAISSIMQTTAHGGGNVTSDGGAAVTARGVCWSTNATPTVADSKTTDGTGTGSFTSAITGLTAGTNYYVRAYSTNSAGTGYGSAQPFTTTGSPETVTDIDGNVYQTITIGTQVWMMENLKVTHYSNGNPIPNVTDSATWTGLYAGARCDYDNDVNNVATYGRLYNWYAVADSRSIAPSGWHVASDAEWQVLVDYLGGDAVAGGKLKEAGTTHWFSNRTGTNESGFTALPGGERGLNGTFYVNGMGGTASFWSSTAYYSTSLAWFRTLHDFTSEIYRSNINGKFGFSVRCVRD